MDDHIAQSGEQSLLDFRSRWHWQRIPREPKCVMALVERLGVSGAELGRCAIEVESGRAFAVGRYRLNPAVVRSYLVTSTARMDWHEAAGDRQGPGPLIQPDVLFWRLNGIKIQRSESDVAWVCARLQQRPERSIGECLARTDWAGGFSIGELYFKPEEDRYYCIESLGTPLLDSIRPQPNALDAALADLISEPGEVGQEFFRTQYSYVIGFRHSWQRVVVIVVSWCFSGAADLLIALPGAVCFGASVLIFGLLLQQDDPDLRRNALAASIAVSLGFAEVVSSAGGAFARMRARLSRSVKQFLCAALFSLLALGLGQIVEVSAALRPEVLAHAIEPVSQAMTLVGAVTFGLAANSLISILFDDAGRAVTRKARSVSRWAEWMDEAGRV